jgi:hypothetical protein
MIPEPNIPQEIADRQGHRDILAAWFKLHPLEDIGPDELERLVGRNYQQRISDCRLELGMTLQNRPRTVQDGAGKVKRLSGAYRYLPMGEPLGRDSGQVVAAGWPGKHGRPFEEEFRLR